MAPSPRSLLAAAFVAAASLSQAHAADFVVSTQLDAGPGSLRQAILDANAAAGADTILFTFDPGSATVPQIPVTGALPDITDPLTIQGNYQTGTNNTTAVEILSTGLSAGQSILTVTSGGTTLRNLMFVSSTAGTVGLTLTGGGANVLDGLRVGINSADQVASAGLHGLVIASDDNIITGCRIGGASAGDGIRLRRAAGIWSKAVSSACDAQQLAPTLLGLPTRLEFISWAVAAM